MSSSSTSSTPSDPRLRPSSTVGSPMPRVERATYVTHGVTANVEEAVARLRALSDREGVTLVEADADPQGAVVLGGDGTMLFPPPRFLDTGVPVIGANFGR